MKVIVSFTVTYEVNHMEIDWPGDDPLLVYDEVAEILETDVLPELASAPLTNPKDITVYSVKKALPVMKKFKLVHPGTDEDVLGGAVTEDNVYIKIIQIANG